ncbi:MAG: hypothetical protein DSY58_00725 [Desulfobulbus sp.]|nr:MAG: hypothetical protein DSY58_00725 [Desulfobulbus sp.]
MLKNISGSDDLLRFKGQYSPDTAKKWRKVSLKGDNKSNGQPNTLYSWIFFCLHYKTVIFFCK